MSERLSNQKGSSDETGRANAPAETEQQAAPGEAEHGKAAGDEAGQSAEGASGAGPRPDTGGPHGSTQRARDRSAGRKKVQRANAKEEKNDLLGLKPELRRQVDKRLKEGSTFEDVVEWVNARGGQRTTLNAVKTYFQSNRLLQTERALRQVEDAEALLSKLDKDPKSAEARLARATFLTGYSRVNRDTSDVTPKEAARYRMECENLGLKRQILTMQKKKAKQELAYSRAKTNLIQITQGKLQGEILMLERELRAHHAGDPIGANLLERIQQLYGLVSQPLVSEEIVDALAKA